MTSGRALREGLTFFLLVGWESVYWLIALLAICAIGTAVAVVLQNELMTGLARRRTDRAFSAFTTACRGVVDALAGRRFGQAWRRFRQALSRWLSWNNSTAVGRFGCALMGAVAAVLAVLAVMKLAWFFVDNW